MTKDVVIIPAYNEEGAIDNLLNELAQDVPDLDVIVISDGSTDSTAFLARKRGVTVLDLPCNLGVGGAVQTGFRYAYERGYRYVIRIDGDGQHPPAAIPKLLSAMEEGNADLIIGSRFAGRGFYVSSLFRFLGIKILAFFLSRICRSRITDPTSGFWLVNRKLLYYFAHDYPTEYPEPEAIALLRRYGFSFKEEAVDFRPRMSGRSSIGAWGTVYYMVKVGLALVVDRIRPINPRFRQDNRDHIV
ncbi:MAG: glycosyltransferase family 2 protein [Deltaproteobacteria bacterium]|nr:glycosyltransferase family 2 protein [Deltaproteobacteria bacterium]